MSTKSTDCYWKESLISMRVRNYLGLFTFLLGLGLGIFSCVCVTFGLHSTSSDLFTYGYIAFFPAFILMLSSLAVYGDDS